MELAADVLNPQGRSLLKAGSVLGEKHLMAFKAWGVTEADIKGSESGDSYNREIALVSETTLRQLEEELSFIFQKCDMENSIVAEIYRLVRKRSLFGHTGGRTATQSQNPTGC